MADPIDSHMATAHTAGASEAPEADRLWCLEHPSLCALADFLSAFYEVLPADPTRDQRGRAWRQADPVYVAERTHEPDRFDREEMSR